MVYGKNPIMKWGRDYCGQGVEEGCRGCKKCRRISALQQRLLNGIREKLDGVVVNGSLERRYVGNLNLSFAYVEGESLLMGLKEVAVSSGSACTSASLEPSYVLRKFGRVMS